jgi:hypothetical protein
LVSGVLSQYSVMQQTEWAGRKFYTAQDQKGQVVYLLAEPADAPPCAYRHPALPHIQPLTVEEGTRWLIGQVPQGQMLEDLRGQGQLTEADVVGALMSVLDAILLLATCDPPLVPAFLDPACIKKDWLGRWILDYLALAHAPETRSSSAKPLGVYPFGALLYWLLTGQSARMTRIQITKIPAGTSSALQFILIRCLGRSYTSLAELRADVERAGRESEFGALIQTIRHEEKPVTLVPVLQEEPIAVRPLEKAVASRPPLEKAIVSRPPLAMPDIPVDDRPWSLPQKPADGFRKQYLPPPPDPAKQQRARWGFYVLSGLATLALAGVAALKFGLIPEAHLPNYLKTVSPVSAYPGMARASGQVGAEVPDQPAGLPSGTLAASTDRDTYRPLVHQSMEQAAAQSPTTEPPKARPELATPAPQPAPPAPAPKQAPPAQTPPPSQPSQPAPPKQEPPAQQQPPQPQPGTADYLDAITGAMPIVMHVGSKPDRYAFVFPHPRNPYISVDTFNALFGKNVLWVPSDGGIRLLNGGKTILTQDFLVMQDRVWLKLTPALQAELGVSVNAYSSSGLYFSLTS